MQEPNKVDAVDLNHVPYVCCELAAMHYQLEKINPQIERRGAMAIILPLMLAGFCLLIAVGCNPCQCEPTEQTKARAAELSSGFTKTVATHMAASKLTAEMTLENTQAIIDKLNTMEASLVKPQTLLNEEVIKSALEPQEAAKANQPQAHQPVASPSAVRLYVTSSESCEPCVRLWKAVEAGEFDGFDVRKSSDFKGLESYPATRFKDTKGQWRVIYGFNDNTIDSLRHWTGTNQFVSQPIITKSFVSQPDLVSIHNQLHGGGQWTWPGDLATHLRIVHGVDPNGIPANHGTSQVAGQRSSVRLISRGSPRGWRTNYQARATCPAGGCPR